MSQQFRHKYTPCCDAFARNGYCGQEDAGGRQQYNLCPTPEQYFFWDYENPTPSRLERCHGPTERTHPGFLRNLWLRFFFKFY